MNPLPSAPLTPDTFAPAPAWAGFGQPAALPAVQSPIITREQLTRHLEHPAAWRTLPDGTPLRLQAEGLEYIIDDFGGFIASELRSAHRLLYFATRTEAQMRALWIPPVPRGDEQPEGLALHVRALQADIGAWASATFAPDAFREVRRLGLLLWTNIMERMPVSGEKKNPQESPTPGTPDSASPISATCAGSSPAETPSDTSSSPLAPTSAPSSPPSSVGATSTTAPSSPSPKNPAASPPPAPSCTAADAHPVNPVNPVNPDSGQPFWVAELLGRQPLLYATGAHSDKGWSLTTDIHAALHFHDAESCDQWILTTKRPEAWAARDHLCLAAPQPAP